MAEELRFAIKCRASRQRPVLKRSCSKCSLASGPVFRPGSQLTHRHFGPSNTYVPARRPSAAAHGSMAVQQQPPPPPPPASALPPSGDRGTIQLSLTRQQSMNLQQNLQQLLLDLKQQNGGTGLLMSNVTAGAGGSREPSMTLPPPPPPPVASTRLMSGAGNGSNPLLATRQLGSTESNNDFPTGGGFNAAYSRSAYDAYEDEQQ